MKRATCVGHRTIQFWMLSRSYLCACIHKCTCIFTHHNIGGRWHRMGEGESTKSYSDMCKNCIILIAYGSWIHVCMHIYIYIYALVAWSLGALSFLSTTIHDHSFMRRSILMLCDSTEVGHKTRGTGRRNESEEMNLERGASACYSHIITGDAQSSFAKKSC